MTVGELIEKLSKLDGELAVTVWDAKDDAETTNVFVDVSESSVLISSVSLGETGAEKR